MRLYSCAASDAGTEESLVSGSEGGREVSPQVAATGRAKIIRGKLFLPIFVHVILLLLVVGFRRGGYLRRLCWRGCVIVIYKPVCECVRSVQSRGRP